MEIHGYWVVKEYAHKFYCLYGGHKQRYIVELEQHCLGGHNRSVPACQCVQCTEYDFNASEFSNYLYQKDPSGKPGLFLTGNIPLQNVKKLSDASTHSEFIRNKILWFSHGKLIKDPELFQTLSDQRQLELKSIFKQLEDKREQISREVINILTRNLPQQMLLTVMIGHQFVGQIQDYVNFFNKGILNKKGIEERLVCNVCNKLRLVAPYKERSLPFFFSDKIHFFDNNNITRSFPL